MRQPDKCSNCISACVPYQQYGSSTKVPVDEKCDVLFWEARLLASATLNLGIIVKVQKDYIRRALKHTKSTVHEKHINLMTIQTYNVSISSLGERCSEPLETYSSNLVGKFSLYQKIEKLVLWFPFNPTVIKSTCL